MDIIENDMKKTIVSVNISDNENLQIQYEDRADVFYFKLFSDKVTNDELIKIRKSYHHSDMLFVMTTADDEETLELICSIIEDMNTTPLCSLCVLPHSCMNETSVNEISKYYKNIVFSDEKDIIRGRPIHVPMAIVDEIGFVGYDYADIIWVLNEQKTFLFFENNYCDDCLDKQLNELYKNYHDWNSQSLDHIIGTMRIPQNADLSLYEKSLDYFFVDKNDSSFRNIGVLYPVFNHLETDKTVTFSLLMGYK